MTFEEFKTSISKQFAKMSRSELFRTGIAKDDLWATYLNSFPSGSNPIFRERTVHDCSCCRQFIKTIGDVVVVENGKTVSIWDCDIQDSTYKAVAQKMSELVKTQAIENRFLHYERSIGTDKNFEQLVEGIKTWEHFFVHLPLTNQNEKSIVCSKAEIGPKLSEARAHHDVFFRSLSELKVEAINTVLDLIAQNSLYRGEEHKSSIQKFLEAKQVFDSTKVDERDNLVWASLSYYPGAVSKIRNTSIGTLLVDLSEGRDLESAVSAFERMVAPANYKRPTALVTQAMINKAKETVNSLGLMSALERRFATLSDISINNVIFADRNARKIMSDNPFDDLPREPAAKADAFDRISELSIDKFLSDVVSKADSIEVLFENKHVGNLVSLVAPVDPSASSLFKWANSFSWSYNGDVADSIKERVKRAGGNVSGVLCCRLAWFNTDDLDLHLHEPSGEHIFYAHKQSSFRTGGQLDVDMNVGGETRTPVENIFYPTEDRMPEGRYSFWVNQYNKRETKDVGFEIEIDWRGETHHMVYGKPVRHGENIDVATLRYAKRGESRLELKLPATTAAKKMWDIDTQHFHRVTTIMLSPNYWDGQGVGNKHFFFMLDGCHNDGSARGFYNEFLRGDLDKHRKVFELVGAKMRTNESKDQLSGLGFSSTQRNSIVIRVKGSFTRVVRVTF